MWKHSMLMRLTTTYGVNDLAVIASSLPLHRCKDNYNALDREITRAMLHSVKSSKRPAGKYAWSPKLREAGLLARYWHLRLTEVQKGYCLSTPIFELKTRLRNLQVQGHPEHRVFEGCEGYFSFKNNKQVNKLEKSSKKSDFWNKDRTDTLTKSIHKFIQA
jgi:hypothetical protein